MNTPPASPTARLDRWLSTLVARAGSDLLLIPGAPPCICFEGTVHRLAEDPLDGPDTEDAVLPALTPSAPS